MTSSAQHQLRRHIFGDETGLVALFSGKRGGNGQKLHSTTSVYYQWPERASEITTWLQNESQRGREAYQCAHLVKSRRRVKDNASLMLACYVDADGALPAPDQPQPTAVVESSPGRHQLYYQLTKAIDPKRGEQINRRLANMMQADMSGWDLTQLLRPPGTRNWKYDQRVEVKVISIEDRAYDPDELERILPDLPDDVTPRAEVKLDRSAAATPIGDRDQRALDRMRAGKRGPELQMLEAGGSKLRKSDGSPDTSADDLSYFAGLAFWLDKDPARMARAAESSGRVRDKWYERHAADGSTYLEMTIAQAIAGCSQSFRDMTGYDAGDEPQRIQSEPKPARAWPIGSDGATTGPAEDEDELTRLRRENAELRQENTGLSESNRDLLGWVDRTAGFGEDLQACNATLSRKLTAATERLAVLEPIIAQIDEIIERPETTTTIGPDGKKFTIKNGPTSDDKLTAITVARWMPYYRDKRAASGEPETIALGYLSKLMGMPRKRISRSLARQSSKDPDAGAPWHAKVTREPKFDDDGAPVINPRTGKQEWESSLEVIPWGDTQAMLKASAKYVLPELPKHGGSPEATAHRWGRCDRCPDAPVTLQGRCTGCKRVLGETTISVDEFLALNVQVGHSETNPLTVDEPVNSIERQNGHSDHPRPADRLNLQVVDSDLARAAALVALPMAAEADPSKRFTPKPVNLGQIRMTDPGAGVFDIPEDAPHTIAVDVGPPEEDAPDWLAQWPDDPPARPEPLVPPSHLAYFSRTAGAGGAG